MQTNRKVLSVRDLTRYIKLKLETDNLLQRVWAQGEISNFTHHSSGHMYFTLKDAHSRIKCVMFKGHNRQLPFMPREGSKVITCGQVSVFDRDGQYQLYVTEMQPDGIGGLFLAFEQLKQKLEAEGLFATERKRPVPVYPQAIGVITSPTGAAVRDIITTLQRRHPSVPIILYPVSVQGTSAAASIAKAIAEMNQMNEVEVLIIGRGGGSLEELWAFNEEIVARSIHASEIPVISAVGHETDFTIADFVADLRAATPTAAAELAVPHHLELKTHLHHLKQRIQSGLIQQMERRRERLERVRRSPFFLQPQKQLLEPMQRLDRIKEQLAHHVRHQLQRHKEACMKLEHRVSSHNPIQRVKMAHERLEAAEHRMRRSVKSVVHSAQLQLHGQLLQLDALSPLKVMQRGYSLVYHEEEQRLIKSLQDVQLGDSVKVQLVDGQLHCQVWSMEGEKS